jgi:hypothetical protein
MKKLLLTFFILVSTIGYSQIIHTDFPKNTNVEFSDTKIIVKTIGLPDMNLNVISKNSQNNFDMYLVTGDIKITHAKNFPIKGVGIIEFKFFNTKIDEEDSVTFSYKIE